MALGKNQKSSTQLSLEGCSIQPDKLLGYESALLGRQLIELGHVDEAFPTNDIEHPERNYKARSISPASLSSIDASRCRANSLVWKEGILVMEYGLDRAYLLRARRETSGVSSAAASHDKAKTRKLTGDIDEITAQKLKTLADSMKVTLRRLENLNSKLETDRRAREAK